MADVADLEGFERVDLVGGPTPLHPLPRLSEELGTEIWIKRDDLGATGLGGNKLRKLEYLVGDALATGCDALVTFGAVQSNHARQTAAAAARFGLECHVILARAVPRTDDLYLTGGNLLLDELFGARVWTCDADPADLATTVHAVEAELSAAGATARWIATGGSEPVGALGYVAAAAELHSQFGEADLDPCALVFASASGGTHAGLVAGIRRSAGAAGRRPPVVGVGVYASQEETRSTVRTLEAEVSALLDMERGADSDIRVLGGHLGPGYGVPTDDMRGAVAMFARCEGLVLDPVYTGKAAAGLVAGCRSGEFGADGPVVFLHTGGSPGVFAYGRDILA